MMSYIQSPMILLAIFFWIMVYVATKAADVLEISDSKDRRLKGLVSGLGGGFLACLSALIYGVLRIPFIFVAIGAVSFFGSVLYLLFQFHRRGGES